MPVTTLFSSQRAADEICQRTGFTAYTSWIRALCATGILTDHSTNRSVRIDATELDMLITRHPYRALPFEYLGVSLGPMNPNRPAFHRAAPWPLFRTHAGYDHHNTFNLTPAQRAHAITARWNIDITRAHDIVDRGLPLVGCVGGLVTPQMIYWPTGVVELQGGIGFDVDPQRIGHPDIPTGALIDVEPGNVWRLVPAQPFHTDASHGV